VRDRLALHAAAVTVAAAILAPLARPGYVLSYDMLFVPRQPLRWDLVAPIDSPPRAVPLDALVSLASQAIPGWLLQRAVLLAIVWAAVVGAARLVPAARLGTRLIAGVAYGWTPFLAERLLLGQWALLVAYAALPWLVSGLLRHRALLSPDAAASPSAPLSSPSPAPLSSLSPAPLSSPSPAPLSSPSPAPGSASAAASPLSPEPSSTAAALFSPTAMRRSAVARWRGAEARALAQIALCAGLSAITPTGGVIAAAVCLALTPWRRWWAIGGILLVLNAPWLAASLVTTAAGRSDPAGVAAFAPRGALELLASGGIWNAETTPASRSAFVVPFVTIVFVALAIWGYPRLRFPAGLTIVTLAGLALALLSTLHSGQTTLVWLVTHVPGAGLLRDTQKFVLPYALLLALCAALGAERLVARLPAEPARIVLAGVMLLPVFTMPDLAWGGAGALRPVKYPPDWPAVAAIVGERPGEVLSLPLSEYRHYSWNHRRNVIDVAQRYLPAPVLRDDTLVVGDVTIAGENPRLTPVRAWLRGGATLPSEIAWVLVQGDPPVTPPAGLVPVYNGQYLALYHNPGAQPSNPDSRRRLPIVLAELAALALMILAFTRMAVRSRR
jgi:hypothetical protein